MSDVTLTLPLTFDQLTTLKAALAFYGERVDDAGMRVAELNRLLDDATRAALRQIQ